MKKILFLVGIVTGAISLGTSVTRADVLTVGSGWATFFTEGIGTPFSTDYQFTLTAPAIFKITDSFWDGDQYAISIKGIVYDTSVPANDTLYIDGDYDASFASPSFSHLALTLGPGTYDVTGTEIQSATGFNLGGGAAELVAPAVPEPSTWAMMILGFLGIGVMAYRKKGALRFA